MARLILTVLTIASLGAIGTITAIAGCGSNTIKMVPANLNDGTFSCDYVRGGARQCRDNTWTGGPYSTADAGDGDWAASCARLNGTPGSGCKTTGTIGGCQQTQTVGDITLTFTTWYFSGRPADYMTPCTNAMPSGQWVMP